MGRILKRRVAALALTAGLLAGGAIAAVAATGGSGGSTPTPQSTAAKGKDGPQLLATAADYLGISRGQLRGELRSGQSLAQIATAAGKPEAGLQQALGQAASSKIEQRAKTASGTQKTHRTRLHRHNLRIAAAAYLGMTPSELAQQLREGSSLAQIADRTPGHSAQGLIDALVQARLSGASKSGASGKQATNGQRLAKLEAHIKSFVEKAHGKHQANRTATSKAG